MKKTYFFYLFKYGLSVLFLFCLTATFAQQTGSFTGKVVDENAQPLPGATVHVKGTDRNVATDKNGQFKIELAQTAITVTVTFIGYDVSEKIMSANQSVNIQLRPNAKSLSEIVVLGYGTAKKSDLTGAVTNISNKDFNQGPVTNPLQQITGHAAGVVITQTGSEPGSTPNIKIRGISSINGSNDPLVVIDGVQGGVGILSQISPSEIESIDVLKDASATAIYGSRGATGVVIVTMKKGRPGKTSVEYTTSASVDVVSRSLKMFTADEWSQQAVLHGVPATSNFGANTDWVGLLTRNGFTQNHTIALGGGTDNFSYRASFGAILNNGIVIHSDNQRYLGRLEATQKALDNKLSVTLTLNNSIANNNGSPGSIGRAAFTSNLISNAYISRPTDPIYKADGTYFTDPNLFEPLNVLAAANTIQNNNVSNRLLGSIRANIQLFKGFSGEVFGSWGKTDGWNGQYIPAVSTLASAINAKGTASVSSNYNDMKVFDGQLSYRTDFGKSHLDATAVYEWQSSINYGVSAASRGFVNDIASYNNLQLGDFSKVQSGDYGSSRDERRGISFKGRVNYSFMDRYLLTASISRDGSTVFGANHKWGNFPSVALAWKLDQEPFMRSQKLFTTLKLRGGYGVTGNQAGISIGQSQQFVSGSGTVYFAGGLQTNFKVNQNSNADAEWEHKNSTNLGIDFALLKNGRLSGSFDAYNNKITKLLYGYTVPQPPFPATNVTANIGSMQNRGLELALSYDLISNSTTRLSIGGNATVMDSKLLNLNGTFNGVPLTTTMPGYGGANGYLVPGMAVGTIYILQHKGVTTAGAETIVDQDGNGTIDASATSKDRVLEGQNQPKYTFAFTPSFSYKNFDASLVLRGSGGNKLYNQLRANLSFFENLGKSNLLESAVETNMFTSSYYGTSDYWLESGAFMRLENVALGYKIPTPKIKYISGFHLSLTGQNLFLITKYKGVDPEETGGDNGIYPRIRSFALGLNIVLK
jgi:TonB-linked SusC/RagA family outer membrane protein